MTNEELPAALPPDLESLFATERRAADPPADVRADVLARVRATVALPAGSGGSAAAAMANRLSIRAGKGLAVIVLGMSIGAGLLVVRSRHTVLEPAVAEPHVLAPIIAAPVVHSRSSVPPVAIAGPVAPAVVAVPSTTGSTPVATRPIVPIANSRSVTANTVGERRGDDLARETALLGVARTALGHRDSAAALVAVQRHHELFPHGALSEEREGIWVQSLVVAGDAARARSRAADFRAHYPHSVFMPVIDAALRAIP